MFQLRDTREKLSDTVYSIFYRRGLNPQLRAMLEDETEWAGVSVVNLYHCAQTMKNYRLSTYAFMDNYSLNESIGTDFPVTLSDWLKL